MQETYKASCHLVTLTNKNNTIQDLRRNWDMPFGYFW